MSGPSCGSPTGSWPIGGSSYLRAVRLGQDRPGSFDRVPRDPGVQPRGHPAADDAETRRHRGGPLLAKLRQLPPSVPNAVLIAIEGETAEALDVAAATRALRARADAKDEAFFVARGFEGTRPSTSVTCASAPSSSRARARSTTPGPRCGSTDRPGSRCPRGCPGMPGGSPLGRRRGRLTSRRRWPGWGHRGTIRVLRRGRGRGLGCGVIPKEARHGTSSDRDRQ